MPRSPPPLVSLSPDDGQLVFHYAIPDPHYRERGDGHAHPGPSARAIARATVRVTNVSSSAVAVKAKTSAPAGRCSIKPTCAVLEPGETVAANVAMKLDGSLNGEWKMDFLYS